MASYQLRLTFGDIGKFLLDALRNTSVKTAARVPKHRAVGRILDEGVVEQIGGIRWLPLPEQQPSIQEPIQSSSELMGRLPRHRLQHLMRKITTDRGGNLGHLLGGAKPIE